MRTAAGVLAAFAGGLGGAAQSRVNAALAGRLHDGIAAALVSNLTALLLVTAAMAVTPAARAGLRQTAARLRRGTLRPWECAGGACGAVYVASQGLSAATLGLAAFTVAVVAGQTGGGLAVDRTGLAPGGSRPISRSRALGAAATVAAVALAAGGRLRTGTSPLLALLPLLAGAALAVQGALNGRVRQAAGAVLPAVQGAPNGRARQAAGAVLPAVQGAPNGRARQAAGAVLPAVFLNAAVGTAALLLVFAGAGLFSGWPPGPLPTQPWLYTGGAIGVCFTAIGIAVVRRIGVLLLGLAVIAGQLTGATALDLIAPGPSGPPGAAGILGVALTLTAVLAVARTDRTAPTIRSRHAPRT